MNMTRPRYIKSEAVIEDAKGSLAVIREALRCEKCHVPAEKSGVYRWISDNWYVTEEAFRGAAADMRAIKRLPAGDTGVCRVYSAAREYAIGQNCAVTPESVLDYLTHYQRTVSPLTEAELAVFIPAIKFALLRVLAKLCSQEPDAVSTDEAGSASAKNIYTSLRALTSPDFSEIPASASTVGRMLAQDPASVYTLMDKETQASYRHEISVLAERHGISETQAAERALSLSRERGEHIGRYIFELPLGRQIKKHGGRGYIAAIVWACLLLAVTAGVCTNSAATALLALIPLSELVKKTADALLLRHNQPRHIPKLDLSEGIPDVGRTLCAMSIMLSDAYSSREAALRLEEYMLSNRDKNGNLRFGLLADLPESASQERERANAALTAAGDAVTALNEKYGGGFFLFYRARVFNKREKKYMPWERKRGAVLELCSLLTGGKSSLRCERGDTGALAGVRYLIVLDSDTKLLPGTAAQLIGAAMHPLCAPRIDREKRIVIRGSGIIQPRVSVSISASTKSDFSKLFAGQGGGDPYQSTGADLYQDAFGSGIFCGKGLIDIGAYMACLGSRFPESTILSHDLLEGEYLGCTFAGDVELSDGFPCRASSYYRRLHRWTRGDWQTAPWLFRRVPTGGTREKNPLGPLDRWRIFDNLRRSLVTPLTFVCLVCGLLMPLPAGAVLVAAALLVLGFDLLIALFGKLFARSASEKARYRSAVYTGRDGMLMRTMSSFILLPYGSWVLCSAILTALWRMLVSHRKMLQWVTAADAEAAASSGVRAVFAEMWPAVVLGTFCILPAHSSFLDAAGIIWILSPLYSLALSRQRREAPELSARDKNDLMRYASDIWRFFEEFVSEYDNWLPPDNMQEQPACGLAHRTSPTNIGLYLLSAAAASDLGLITPESAVGMISRTLGAVASLPKWNGHLYNWYDTRELTVMRPAYVSAVDCGNFAAALTALYSFLAQNGAPELCAAISAMLSRMDFSLFYDKRRELFHIGWSAEENAMSDSWYDLFSSEARLLSYYAVARGQVPRRHWRTLGRQLVSLHGFRGTVSWTGTMFEYFMPELLLPCRRDALIFESLHFCLYAQKRAVSGVWGMSESAYYSFDNNLGYKYKANGAQKLALKRDMDTDRVIAPYASFLALPIAGSAGVKNLRRLAELGCVGRYGFYEAVDFTPERTAGSKYELVKTYMAHHLGMSLIAIDNALRSSVMCRRFFDDREMAAYGSLLEERVPTGGASFVKPKADTPEKPERITGPVWEYKSDGIEPLSPVSCLLTNGAYSVVFSDNGMNRSACGGRTLTKRGRDSVSNDAGIIFFLKYGNTLLPLQAAPLFSTNARYSSAFSDSCALITAENGDICAQIETVVPFDENGEQRTVTLTSKADRSAELVCYFEPILAEERDYLSHPAFSKLSLETACSDGCITVARRPRAGGSTFSLVFTSDCPFTFDTSREASMGRGGLRSLAKYLEGKANGTEGAVLDPCVLTRIPLHLESGKAVSVRYALAFAGRSDRARETALRVLSSPPNRASMGIAGCAARMNLNVDCREQAHKLVSDLALSRERANASTRGERGALWKFGISGDLPTAAVTVSGDSDIALVERNIAAHELLAAAGYVYDLAVVFRNGGEYHDPLRGLVTRALERCGALWRLGKYGGIHVVSGDKREAEAVEASADVSYGSDTLRAVSGVPADAGFSAKCREVGFDYGFDGNNSFVCKMSGALPRNVWSHVLTNGSFGALAADSGCGGMWWFNAREFKINSAINDSLAVRGPESLDLLAEGGAYSLFAADDCLSCEITYGFGFARYEKEIGGTRFQVTAFVPPDIDARVLIIETEPETSFKLRWYTDLLLGPDADAAKFAVTGYADGLFTCVNPSSEEYAVVQFLASAGISPVRFTCSKLSAAARLYDSAAGAGLLPCICAEYEASGCLVLACGCCDEQKLRFLSDPEAARSALSGTLEHWRGICGAVTVRTPEYALDAYMNGWAIYQTYACRLLARASFYQCGGAYGYRDQLQDVCALCDTLPNAAQEHILRAAGHQFREGDVQHWWHPSPGGSTGAGIRTRCSDDLLWLPYALCVYCKKTGDFSLCSETAPYLISRPLSDTEAERYERAQAGAESEDLFTHAKRALDLVISRGTGSHGLCLIGSGDWNDGMNLVGAKGRGESVWLTWFAAIVADMTSALCRHLGDAAGALRYAEASQAFIRGAENAWDGGWYLRGYYDDGRPLGSRECRECSIDSIAQSFAAIAGAGGERTKLALKNAVNMLFDKKNRLVMLFSPPFGDGVSAPGYIKGYSPGFRENGGQYTHGAVWLALGLYRSGDFEAGWQLLKTLLPYGRDMTVYRTEPYVIAADVYSNPAHAGRGGWTWYTGAAGWYRRAALEELLGLRVRGGMLYIEPALPCAWPGYEAVWRGKNVYEISVKNGQTPEITVNGEPYDGCGLPVL